MLPHACSGPAMASDNVSHWLSEAIVDFLRGPLYIHPLMSFIDEKVGPPPMLQPTAPKVCAPSFQARAELSFLFELCHWTVSTPSHHRVFTPEASKGAAALWRSMHHHHTHTAASLSRVRKNRGYLHAHATPTSAPFS